MEYRNIPRGEQAADLPDLRERLSAVGATVEQFEAFRRTVASGAMTHEDRRTLDPERGNIETKEQ